MFQFYIENLPIKSYMQNSVLTYIEWRNEYRSLLTFQNWISIKKYLVCICKSSLNKIILLSIFLMVLKYKKKLFFVDSLPVHLFLSKTFLHQESHVRKSVNIISDRHFRYVQKICMKIIIETDRYNSECVAISPFVHYKLM